MVLAQCGGESVTTDGDSIVGDLGELGWALNEGAIILNPQGLTPGSKENIVSRIEEGCEYYPYNTSELTPDFIARCAKLGGLPPRWKAYNV